jgi:hypothetical protein
MTTPQPIEEACEVFEQKLDAFEKLMKHLHFLIFRLDSLSYPFLRIH